MAGGSLYRIPRSGGPSPPAGDGDPRCPRGALEMRAGDTWARLRRYRTRVGVKRLAGGKEEKLDPEWECASSRTRVASSSARWSFLGMERARAELVIPELCPEALGLSWHQR
jgi:hypothetical protein